MCNPAPGGFLQNGHRIKCEPNRPVDIVQFVSIDDAIKRCYQCSCPSGYVDCRRASDADECKLKAPINKQTTIPVQHTAPHATTKVQKLPQAKKQDRKTISGAANSKFRRTSVPSLSVQPLQDDIAQESGAQQLKPAQPTNQQASGSQARASATLQFNLDEKYRKYGLNRTITFSTRTPPSTTTPAPQTTPPTTTTTTATPTSTTTTTTPGYEVDMDVMEPWDPTMQRKGDLLLVFVLVVSVVVSVIIVAVVVVALIVAGVKE